jgi:hypothetical protein
VTLVLTCLTPDYVIQASDRRLTWPDGSLHDDESTKAVFYQPYWVFAFSGLARIGEMTTAGWLATQLTACRSITEVSERVENEAASALAAIRAPAEHKRLTIVGAGWGVLAPKDAPTNGTPPQGLMLAISNCLDGDGGTLPRARPDFRSQVLQARSEEVGLVSIGQSLPPGEVLILARNIRRCLRADTGPGPIGRLLFDQIRMVSRRNRRVGPGVMVSSLPRVGITAPTAAADDLPRDKHGFVYVPAEGESCWLSPIIAHPFGPIEVLAGPAGSAEEAEKMIMRGLPIGR